MNMSVNLVLNGLPKMVLLSLSPNGCPSMPNMVDLLVPFCPAITVTS